MSKKCGSSKPKSILRLFDEGKGFSLSIKMRGLVEVLLVSSLWFGIAPDVEIPAPIAPDSAEVETACASTETE